MPRPVTLTAERARFLGDIIIGAVEGGIGYWSQVSRYRWQDCDAHATVHVVKDDESGYEEEGLALDIEAVERGLKLIREGGCGLNARLRNRLMLADRSNDAGQLDAFDCDVIVQAGLLGEIVYA
jgi:hypothetical protein